MVPLKPPVVSPRLPGVVLKGQARKIGLCGSYTGSLKDTPWHDPSWELWGHASARGWYKRELDRYFDLHRREVWTRQGKLDARHTKWLAKNTVPVMMQEHYTEVPASYEYPKDRIMQEFRPYFTNQVAYMIAMALTEPGVQTLGFFGINYSIEDERAAQRGSCQYWMGFAEGRGIKLVIPKGCTLLNEPNLLYGYESHDEKGVLVKGYKAPERKPGDGLKLVDPTVPAEKVKPPDYLKEEIAAEENARPDWARKLMSA